MVPFRVRVLAHMSNNYPHFSHTLLIIKINVSNRKIPAHFLLANAIKSVAGRFTSPACRSMVISCPRW